MIFHGSARNPNQQRPHLKASLPRGAAGGRPRSPAAGRYVGDAARHRQRSGHRRAAGGHSAPPHRHRYGRAQRRPAQAGQSPHHLPGGPAGM